MHLSFHLLEIDIERELLADWLSSDRWAYHVNPQLSRERVLNSIDQGHFTGTDHRMFWIVADPHLRVGLIHLFDLDDIEDGSPQFDLRIQSQYRRQGIGTSALRWLTSYLFENWTELQRIEGCTRIDNLAMRNVFLHCHYVKEGHYRKAWVTVDGQLMDSIVYGILREDWSNQTSTPVNWDEDHV
jgi:RimJ/RimL family protein N-acetyltransferase